MAVDDRDGIRFLGAKPGILADADFALLAAGLRQIAPWLLSQGGKVMDQGGQARPVQAVHDAAVLTALLTMLPASLLAIYRLYRS